VSGLKPRWGTAAQEANAVPIPTVEPFGEQYPQNLSIWGPMWCGRQSDGSTITSPFLPLGLGFCVCLGCVTVCPCCCLSPVRIH